MKTLTGYGAYRLFIALKAHFSKTNYCFFKYQGKVNVDRASYEARNDKQFFESLSKRYDPKELRDFYLANLLADIVYVTDYLDEEASERHFEYVGRRQSLSYIFENELDKLFVKGAKEAFETVEGEYPKLLIMFMRGQISIETMVILNDFVGFSDKYDKFLGENDLLWSGIHHKMEKYKPFLTYDKEKMRRILKGKINGL